MVLCSAAPAPWLHVAYTARSSRTGTNGKSIRGYALRRAVPANPAPAKSR